MAKANVRATAADLIFRVVDKGGSLSELLPVHAEKVAAKDQALLQAISYGVLRWLPTLEYAVRQKMDAPFTGKKRPLHFLLLVGLYQLEHMRIPDHAAIGETVEGAIKLGGARLKGVINGVLRSLQREPVSVPDVDAVKYAHPGWLLKRLQNAYPNQWQQVVDANQHQAPMWLRVNPEHVAKDVYVAQLAELGIETSDSSPTETSLCLNNPVDVSRLPHFDSGWVSVQDAAAQHSAFLLQSQPGDRVLDACAAPGGKTCHLLEHTPDIAHLDALDIDENRLARVQQNLDRLGLNARLLNGSAAEPQDWWDGELYDRILLDAPCSATGVIRRHPDIKWLRRDSDIQALVTLQAEIMDKIWSLLKPGGTLVYATCSVLPDENRQQVEAFLSRTPDAEYIAIREEEAGAGWQILPGEQNMDGFFYAKLHKKN